MKKSAIVLFLAAFVSISAFAQNVQEGVNHLYAERYQSAKAVFEKMVASNPKNAEATYWLGQTYIRQKDTAAALDLFQKALATNSNAPLVLVGLGQVELMQGKTAEARQRFETAISLSRGKKGDDPNVLNAVGRANVQAKAGDLPYAIQKLTAAAQAAPNNADILLNLGNAYRKAQNGGQAVTNYIKAAQVSSNFAVPHHRQAEIYKTQGNWEVVTTHLNNAIAADPKFAPSYLELYYYYLIYQRDFAKAEEFANKYISNSDPSVENDYLKAQTLFVQDKFDEAINIGKSIITQAGAKTNPRVYRLLAYSYAGKGDTLTAKEMVDQLFVKADEEDIVAQDYVLKANIYAKDNPDSAAAFYIMAAKTDSVFANQAKILQSGIDIFKNTNKKSLEADLRLALYDLKPNKSEVELISIGIPYYYSGKFQKADSLFSIYSKANPDSVYGYLWSSRALAQLDSTMEQGLALPAYEQLLRVAETDKARFKSYGIQASGYLAGYYNNIKKDKERAVAYLRKGLEFDPTNASLQNNIKILSQPTPAPRAQAPAASKPAAKPKK